MRPFLISLLVLSACDTPMPASLVARDGVLSDQGPSDSYSRAARESGVPVELLMAISQVESL
jgi:hypothetical protein